MFAALLPALFLVLISTPATAQPRDFRDCPTCPVMVPLEPGIFTMGADPREEERDGVPSALRGRSAPTTPVTIQRGLSIGKYPVTRAEFLAFAQAASRAPGLSCWAPQPARGGRWEERQRVNWANPGFAQTPQDPVVCVSWSDAVAYADWLTRVTGRRYRLPSEAEWEYAARGGTLGPRYWTETGDATCTRANLRDHSIAALYGAPADASYAPCDDGFAHTSPVTAFPANPFGLHDMLGNVLQWTQDCWNDTLRGQPRQGSARETGDCSQRGARGGSWSNDIRQVRVTFRGSGPTIVRTANTGFRVVRIE
jgi:formylglycine-generating enzyme required for sulfatase activity